MANAINQELGFDVANALSNLDALGKSISNVSGRVSRFGTTLQKFNAQAGNLQSTLTGAGNATTGFGQQIQQTNANVQKLTTSVGLLSRIIFTQLVIKGLRIAEQSLFDAASRAAEFQVKLADIRTISGQTFQSLDEIGTAVEGLSKRLGVDQLQVAAGLYESISNQIGGTKDELIEFNRVSGEFAVASLTDQATALNLLSGILNSYSIDVSRAEEVSGKLNRAIDLGAITGEELASVFGRVAPQARQLGVSLDELLGAFETVTINGVSAAESGTLIRGVITGLQKPSEELSKALKNLGVTSGESLVRSVGFANALRQVAQQTDGSSDALAKLFPNIRGLSGELILAVQDFDRLTHNINETRKAGAELARERFQIVFDTDAKQVERELNTIKVELTGLGEELLHAAAQSFEFAGGAESIIAAVKLGTPVIAAYTANVLALAAAQRSATLQATGLGSALSRLTSLGLAAVIAGSVGDFIGSAINDADFTALRKIRAENEARVSAFAEGETKRLNAARDANEAIVQSALDAGRAQTHIFNDTLDSLQVDEKRLVITAQQGLNRVIGLRERMVRQIEQAAQESTKAIETSQRRISDLRSEIEERQFAKSLLGVEDERQFTFQLQRVTELTERARQELSKAVNDDDISQALRRFQQAEKAGDAAKAIAERLNDRRLEGFAVERLNKLTETQIQAEKQLQQIQERRAQKAADAAQAQSNILDSVKAQAKILVENIPTVGLSQAEIDQRNARRQQALGEILKTAVNSDDISLAETLGLTKLAAELERNPVTLNIDVETTVKGFADRFQAALDNLKLSVPFDTSSLERVLGRELTTADEISRALTDARDEADRLATEISKAEEAQQKAAVGLRELPELLRQAGDFSEAQLAGGGFIGLDNEQLARGRQLLTSITAELQRLSGLTNLTRDDFGAVVQEMDELQAIQKQVTGLPIPIFGNGDRGGFAANFEAMVSALERLSAIANSPSVDPAVESRLRQLQAIIDSSAAVGTNIESALLRGAEAIERAADRFTGINPQFNASGGFARGTDTVPAMLSPGEVVMNRSASQRWFSDLQRMNAGMQPQFRQSGGQVSVGDVSITVQEANTPQATADEVWKQLQRRFRAGILTR